MLTNLFELIIKNIYFWCFSLTSLILIIVSFIIPPTGQIDPSVLQGVAELFAFAALGAVFKTIDSSKEVNIKHNNTDVTISK